MSSLKVLDVGAEQENYRELINRRQNLLLELKNYEQNKKVGSGSQSARSSRSEGKTHHLPSYGMELCTYKRKCDQKGDIASLHEIGYPRECYAYSFLPSGGMFENRFQKFVLA